MRNMLVLLVALFLTISVVSGCGQNQQSQAGNKPAVIHPMSAGEVKNMEENAEEEAPAPTQAAPKTVGESAIDKTAAIQESQQNYQAPTAPAAPVKEEAEAPKTADVINVESPKYSEELLVANFDSGEKPSNLGGNFGAWNKDPSDPTQWCKEGFDNVTKRGDAGFSMRLDYSVDSPNPAYNGFWLMLPNLDASKYDAINFWVKGDPKAGYTTVFKVEVKNANKQVGRFYVSNVTDKWQEISIPLSDLKGLADKTCLTEFVIVFEDRMATNKKGVINIDDIRFVKK